MRLRELIDKLEGIARVEKTDDLLVVISITGRHPYRIGELTRADCLTRGGDSIICISINSDEADLSDVRERKEIP